MVGMAGKGYGSECDAQATVYLLGACVEQGIGIGGCGFDIGGPLSSGLVCGDSPIRSIMEPVEGVEVLPIKIVYLNRC